MPDFGSTDLDAFRAEARAWIEANFPASLKGHNPMGGLEGPPRETEDTKAWKKAMGAKGWGVPTWPAEYGGGGLTHQQNKVLQEEMNRAGAYNPIGGMGVGMFGPTLLEYGTDDQKKRHMPGIVSGDVWWCQGYSEPGAGSDLAGLQTKLEDRGDHWVVNGQKIWTSGAQYADWCFCLVRTDTTKKHEGISFVLINMRQKGVETRPIKLIAGNSPFCETFFTDARVEKNDMLGPMNGGWTVGKRLLQFERQGQGSGRMVAGADLSDLAKKYVGADEQGRIADLDLRTRVIGQKMGQHAFQLTLARVAEESRGNSSPSAATSIMKNAGTQLGQLKAELTLEIMGHQGLGWEGDEFSAEETTSVRSWLSGKATTIFGGSQEIQSNIISKRILGLPDSTRSV